MDALRAHSALASLVGLDPDQQLHRLQAKGLPPLFVEQWWGHEQLASGFDYWVDVLHPDADLPLGTWLGRSGALAEGEADAQGDVSLDDPLCARIWNDAGRFPGRLFLVHGIDVIPLQRPRPYSSSPGVRATLDTLEAINYGKTLADVPDDAALYAYRQRAEYEFQSHIDADPAQRKEI